MAARTTPRAAKPRIAVVGFGRMGGALARGFQRAKLPVAVLPRSGESVRAAVAMGLRLAETDWLERADLCFLTVPDAAISEVAADVAALLRPGCAVVHCAGAKDLEILKSAGRRPRGSFHPLCAVSARSDSLAGTSVALAASDRKLLAVLRRLVDALGLRAITVDERHRAAYHAGAVLSAGGVVALASLAVDALGVAGIPPKDALAALLPLMRSAIAGLERRGLPDALTGPVVRGDAAAIAGHLAELPADARAVYRELMARSLELVGNTLPPARRRELARVLRSGRASRSPHPRSP